MSGTRFHLVRHGPTHVKGMLGWTDRPADLSDADRIRRLAGALPEGAVVVSSDLIRARATADALAAAMAAPGPRLPDEPLLREMHFGDWELRTSDEISASHPDLSRAFWTDPGAHRPPGGESWAELSARTGAAFDTLAAAHPGADVVVVAHIGVIVARLAVAWGVPAREAIAQKIDNLSLTEIARGPDGWRVGRVNHAP